MVERFRQLRHRKLLTVVVAAVLLTGIGLIIAQDQETLRVRTDLATEDTRFPEYLTRLLGKPLTHGDAYVVHSDGPDAFTAMLAAIDSAQSRISLETYIFASDETGHRFLEALERAAQRGVKVHIVLDSIGAGKME